MTFHHVALSFCTRVVYGSWGPQFKFLGLFFERREKIGENDDMSHCIVFAYVA